MKKYAILFILCMSIIALSACSTKNSAVMSSAIESISRTEEIIQKLDSIPSQTLVINEIMDSSVSKGTKTERQIVEYEKTDNDKNGYNGSTFTSESMNSYVSKLYSLACTAENSINANETMKYLINIFSSRTSNIKSICKNIVNLNCEISDNQKTSINDLCSNIILNANRIALTKNEIKEEASKVLTLKNNYTSNIEQLTTKYTKLTNSIDTRNTYLTNINNNLFTLNGILDNISCSENDTTRSVFSNVDTYKNSNKNKKNKDKTQNPDYYYNNNYDNYNNANGFTQKGHSGFYNGRGGTNPFYNNGYGVYGGSFGGYGGYPSSPYSNYNPYIPNIDTFGTYTNVDTYKDSNQSTNNDNISNNDNDIDKDFGQDYSCSNCIRCPYCNGYIYIEQPRLYFRPFPYRPYINHQTTDDATEDNAQGADKSDNKDDSTNVITETSIKMIKKQA